jgi:Tol biopolymer transport system component
VLSGLVSHYRVVSTLGAGGMGVVHKAIDTRLNRPVAIKAIPEGIGLDTAAVLRLRAEAQSAASLDHPYICKIYELLDTDSGTLIVMEFVEGETLASLLLREGPLPVPTVMRYAAEIAEGLAAAHATGLVHRDVKPSNVMITPHNHVKLLDFGIAHNPAAGPGSTATESMQTRPGSVAGSPFYMAPEQALGRPVDGRTDVFSLGAVLFECLTGSLPFEGASRDAYVVDMLTGRPRALLALAPTVPQPVADLVTSCLERNPELRPDASSVAAYLRAEAPTGSTDRFFVPVRGSWKRLVLTSLAFLALAVPVGWGIYRWAVPVLGPTAGRYEALITWPSEEKDPRLSPDQRWVSFISNRDGIDRLFVVNATGGEARPLTDLTDRVLGQVWSQDGTKIAALVQTNEGSFVRVLQAPFGASLPTTESFTKMEAGSRLVRWVGDDLFFVTPASALYRKREQGKLEQLDTNWKFPGRLYGVDVSPDGKRVVCAVQAAEGQEDLWVADIDGQRARQLTKDQWIERTPVWSRGGKKVVFQSNRGGQLDLWEMDVEGGRLWQLTSSPTEELFGEGSDDGASQTFQQVNLSANLYALRPEQAEPIQLTADALSDFAPSAAGNVVAFQRTRPSLPFGHRLFDAGVLVGRMETGRLVSEDVAQEEGFAPRLSPKGSLVAYFQRSSVPGNLVLRVRNLQTGHTTTAADRAAVVSLGRFPQDWSLQNLAWAGDSGELYFVAFEEKIYSIRGYVPGARPSRRVLTTAAAGDSIRDLHVSPDGRRLAYLKINQQRQAYELHAQDLSTGEDTVLSSDSGTSAVYCRGWTRDGRSVILAVRTPGDPPGMKVREVKEPGAIRDVATVTGALASTARVDERRAMLYVTRVERGVHNIARVSLATGDVQMVTANKLQSVSFGGFAPLDGGTLMYSRDERRSDIWVIRDPGRD